MVVSSFIFYGQYLSLNKTKLLSLTLAYSVAAEASSPTRLLIPVRWPVVAPPCRSSKLLLFQKFSHINTSFLFLSPNLNSKISNNKHKSLDLRISIRKFRKKRMKQNVGEVTSVSFLCFGLNRLRGSAGWLLCSFLWFSLLASLIRARI